MSISDEQRRDAQRTEAIVRNKLLEIMDLQADIDGLLRDVHPSPFGSKNWRDARPETMQRIVAMTAIQFVLFEPPGWVKGNDEFKIAAEKLVQVMVAQLKTLKTKKSDV